MEVDDRKHGTPTPALRVSQLDAAELDNDVLTLVKLQLHKLVKYHQTNLMVKYEPEINATLKFLIWKFTIFSHDATIGQQILNLKYSDENRASFHWISRQQKLLYALVLIGCPWTRERSDDILSLFGLTSFKDMVDRCINWIEISLKIATLGNFLIFLQKGTYQSLVERLLGIRSMFPQRQGIRQVSFEYMTRELMWHGFSELLFFILPLVNFQRIKNFALRNFLNPKSSKSPKDWSERNVTSCAVCGNWPVSPREIGCTHVFCYFCIKSNYKSDPGFTCPLCNHGVTNEDSIKQLSHRISGTDS